MTRKNEVAKAGAKEQRRPTTTVRIYEDTHHALWKYIGPQRPRPKLQDVIAEAVDEFLKKKKRGA